MALPTSGQIGMSQINTELRRVSSSYISLDTAENGGYATINQNSSRRPNSSNPAAISEWYGYNHRARPPVPTFVSLRNVGWAGNSDTSTRSLDLACQNSFRSPGQYWGNDGRMTVSASELQFWANSAGTIRPPAGFYAQESGEAIYWDGARPTRLEFCRI